MINKVRLFLLVNYLYYFLKKKKVIFCDRFKKIVKDLFIDS